MGLIKGWDLIIDSFLDFVRHTLRASVNVDYNLRRKGKRFLANLIID